MARPRLWSDVDFCGFCRDRCRSGFTRFLVKRSWCAPAHGTHEELALIFQRFTSFFLAAVTIAGSGLMAQSPAQQPAGQAGANGSQAGPNGSQSVAPLTPPRAGYSFPTKQTLTYAVD